METVLSSYPVFDFKKINKTMCVREACEIIVKERFDVYARALRKDVYSRMDSLSDISYAIEYFKLFDTLDELITILNNKSPIFRTGDLEEFVRSDSCYGNGFLRNGPIPVMRISSKVIEARKLLKALNAMEKDLYRTFGTYSKLFLESEKITVI